MARPTNRTFSIPLIACICLATASCGIQANDSSGGPPQKPAVGMIATAAQAPPQPMEKVVKSPQEWRELLTPEQYRITREAGTERPFGQAYKEFKTQPAGTYYCVCCGTKLFDSTTKFDSGCGWPSFYDPATAEGVKEKKDVTLGMVRIEVVCSNCDAHLGHVFDGEGFKTPTDRRYCINAAALRFVPQGKPDGAPQKGGRDDEKSE